MAPLADLVRLRTTPFPVDALRYIDGLSNDWSITFATSATLKLYGDASKIFAIRDRWSGQGCTRRASMCLELGEMALSIIEKLPAARAAALSASAIPHLVRNVVLLSPILAAWAYEDERKGGAMKPFRNRWRCDLKGEPFPRTRRRLHAPAWIRRYIKQDESAIQMRALASQLFRIEHRMWDLDPADLMMLTDDLERVENMDAQGANFAPDRPFTRWISPDQRKVMKRSAGIACSVLGDDAVSSLLRGEEHDIVGSEFTFRVSVPHGIRHRGHGQLAVKLIVGSEHLADLCLYYPNLPALDQVAALALDVAAGEDRGVYETANIVTMTDIGAEHPAIAAKRNFHLRLDGRPENHLDQEHRQQREYYQATREFWLEPLIVFVFGAHRASGIKRIMLP